MKMKGVIDSPLTGILSWRTRTGPTLKLMKLDKKSRRRQSSSLPTKSVQGKAVLRSVSFMYLITSSRLEICNRYQTDGDPLRQRSTGELDAAASRSCTSLRPRSLRSATVIRRTEILYDGGPLANRMQQRLVPVPHQILAARDLQQLFNWTKTLYDRCPLADRMQQRFAQVPGESGHRFRDLHSSDGHRSFNIKVH